MKRLTILAIIIFWAAGLPGISCADQDEEQAHMEEIARVSKILVSRDFEPITIVTQGESTEDAIIRAARKVRGHIGLKNLSIDLCNCLKDSDFTPKEECELLRQASFTVTKADDGTETVTLVVTLDSAQLKQLALFGLWPLFDKKFRGRISS